MYIKKCNYRPKNQYEVYYGINETGLRMTEPVAKFDSLQDATLFMRYVQGKELEQDQISAIETVICHIDFKERERREERERERAAAKAKRDAKKGAAKHE